jgi:ABC-type nitrate/sulfonate/bicarbonate transport system permease component
LTRKCPNTGDKRYAVLCAALLLGLWETAVAAAWVPRFILPAPSAILATTVRILPALGPHLAVTVREALAGLGLSVLFSVILAVLMDSFAPLKRAVYPLLVASQTVPVIALAPLFALWFGFGELPKMIVVMLVCFFPMVVNLSDGMDDIDPDLIHLLRSMGANRLQIIYHLKFPAVLGSFFSGLRIAATYSIVGAVIGEWLGGETGLGVYMIRAKHSYALDRVFAAILVIVALSLLLLAAIALIQRLAMGWRRLSRPDNETEVDFR